MKKQLDVRVLLVYLLGKLKKLDKEEELTTHIDSICILLSKQILFIQSSERLTNSLILLGPLDTSLLEVEEFTKEELSSHLNSLIKELSVPSIHPYVDNPLFELSKNSYTISSVRFFIMQLCQTEFQIKNES